MTWPSARRIALGGAPDADAAMRREWLVTNALGGYASGTLSGVVTRRHHGLLIAALPDPFGRVVMLAHLWERIRLADRRVVVLSGEEDPGSARRSPAGAHLVEFGLEAGLPVWRYEVDALVLEKRVIMPHRQNTVHVSYRLAGGRDPVRLTLRPSINFRPHEAPVSTPLAGPYRLTATHGQYEVVSGQGLPPLRLQLHATHPAFTYDEQRTRNVLYPAEAERGYEASGELWSPGYFRADLAGAGAEATLVASTEAWDTIAALTPAALHHAERHRRERLLEPAHPAARTGLGAELVLAADQFVIVPQGRREESARARAVGDELRSVIAGYHWFTDWGRDTMISLEGLTLVSGRHPEAGHILRTFAACIRDGLVPNLFPEGDRQGLYHTADATLWYFHALERYLRATGDRGTLRQLLPLLQDVVRAHLRGTAFGIRVDPADGLLGQGTPGLPLTWMDAKVEDWVVTPRRGKPVEINALWYNALRLLQGWLEAEGDDGGAREIATHADRAHQSFNRRFWNPAAGHLHDVVDGEGGDDPACRPNQIFAVSLPWPVLAPARWAPVVDAVERHLLTPVGLRSLSPAHPDYKARYWGDLRARDAAYHQGTVWAWLIGPFIDAWLKVHPDEPARARSFLRAFEPHLGEAGVGSISEIFDAVEPYAPRGCIAQAWSVAEVLRAWVRTAAVESEGPARRRADLTA